MDDKTLGIILNTAVVALALGSLGVLIVRGSLREKTLALGPDRDLGLSTGEYLFGVVFVSGYVGLMLSGGWLSRSRPEDAEPGSAELLVATGALFLPLVIIGLMVGRAMNSEAGLRKIGIAPRHPGRDMRWAGVAVPVAVAFAWSAGLGMIALSQWVGWYVDPVGHESLEQLTNTDEPSDILAIVFAAVVMAPLLEEAVFRGVLQTGLMRLWGGRRWPALLIASALFSVTHAGVVPWQNLVPLFLLGLVFGYLYERTGSLLTPILAHACFNAINIAMVLWGPQAV